MNLVSGKITDSTQTKLQLERLDELINKAYSGEALTAEKVMAACDALSHSISEETHLPLLMSLGMGRKKALAELDEVRLMLSRGYLESRLDLELGERNAKSFVPYGSRARVRQEYKPLGVLFHIAAGNADALPAFSAIEGLLTGNINILKLPGADNGLSIAVLRELIEYEPLIADYVMVFDSPSQDMDAMQKMAQKADALVVWGGDDALQAVRNLAAPDTRIIEWGHKISFAYVSGENVSDEDLEAIAYNICDTNQIFCNSCQGIYLDTGDFGEVEAFARRFLSILDSQAQKTPESLDLFIRAQKTLELYTEELERDEDKIILRTENCSVTAERDNTLTPSHMYRNCWVKSLPKDRILAGLLKYKNHLQTVSLICGEADRESLETILFKTGIVRITSGKNMSKNYCGQPHDGEFPLRRYVKTVSYEYE